MFNNISRLLGIIASLLLLFIQNLNITLVHRRQFLVVPPPYHLFVLVIVVAQIGVMALDQQPSDLALSLRQVLLVARSIARPQDPFVDDLLADRLHVVGLADLAAQVDEGGREVGPVRGVLGGAIVPGEDVMVVVPALAHGQDGYSQIVRGSDVPADLN